MAKDGKDISKERMLYVEGVNDKWVTISLREQYGYQDDVHIEAKDNCERAIKAFGLKLSNPTETRILGLIVDADTNIENRYTEIIDELKRIDIEISKDDIANKDGFIRDVNIGDSNIKIRIGVWIMPDNISNGRIEDFLFSKIDDDNAIMQEAVLALNTLENRAGNNELIRKKMYKAIHKDKAKIHTYMAWNDPPDLSMGIAVKKNFFPKVSDIEKYFKDWINTLYHPETIVQQTKTN